MDRFKNILFVTRSQAVEPAETFSRALELVVRNHARLTVASLIPEEARWNGDLMKVVEHSRLEELRPWHDAAAQQGVTARLCVVAGRHWRELIRLVEADGHDLIMTHLLPATGLREWVFGSTTLHLLRKCPCEVWVLKPAPNRSERRVLAAVDPDRTGDPDLNRKILTLAASLAAHDSARLDVLHAWSFFAEDLLRNRGRLPEEEIAEILRGQEAAHRRQLQAAIEYAGLEPGSYALHLVHGTPHEEIVRHVRREGIQLLVIGTVRRARITGLLIGSTAETVLEQVDCSVLAVKPDAFIPPPLED